MTALAINLTILALILVAVILLALQIAWGTIKQDKGKELVTSLLICGGVLIFCSYALYKLWETYQGLKGLI